MHIAEYYEEIRGEMMATGKLVAVNSFMSLNSFRIKSAAEGITRPSAGTATR